MKGFIDEFGWQFIPKRKAEGLLASVGKTSLLIEPICVAWPCARWMSEDGLYGEFQRIMGDLGH